MYPLFKKNTADILSTAFIRNEDTSAINKIPTRDIELAYRLLDLWKNWNTLMGSPIKDMLSPIDTRNNVLILTVTDSMALQEAHYYKEDILSKIHFFLGIDYFHSISIRHTMGENSLTENRPLIHSREIYKPILPHEFTHDVISNNPTIQRAYDSFLKRITKV